MAHACHSCYLPEMDFFRGITTSSQVSCSRASNTRETSPRVTGRTESWSLKDMAISFSLRPKGDRDIVLSGSQDSKREQGEQGAIQNLDPYATSLMSKIEAPRSRSSQQAILSKLAVYNARSAPTDGRHRSLPPTFLFTSYLGYLGWSEHARTLCIDREKHNTISSSKSHSNFRYPLHTITSPRALIDNPDPGRPESENKAAVVVLGLPSFDNLKQESRCFRKRWLAHPCLIADRI
ncbi:uncharacterized protein RSE6_07589 [Rhynchosporium secalis]|uniref:Uncharacterized protein n=1 Tax=Rhynchosporium secalis TaxID=38038 RepID=A0A1E1MDD9_RHYSE|nr:uncharacterized protein RSE6_07589 [Rhynchosporium secalis]